MNKKNVIKNKWEKPTYTLNANRKYYFKQTLKTTLNSQAQKSK